MNRKTISYSRKKINNKYILKPFLIVLISCGVLYWQSLKLSTHGKNVFLLLLLIRIIVVIISQGIKYRRLITSYEPMILENEGITIKSFSKKCIKRTDIEKVGKYYRGRKGTMFYVGLKKNVDYSLYRRGVKLFISKSRANIGIPVILIKSVYEVSFSKLSAYIKNYCKDIKIVNDTPFDFS